MRKVVIIALAAVGIGAVVWAVVEFRHQQRCQSLKEDVANEVAQVKRNGDIQAYLADSKLNKDLGVMQEQELKQYQLSLTQIYHECGDRAGQTAAREAGV